MTRLDQARALLRRDTPCDDPTCGRRATHALVIVDGPVLPACDEHVLTVGVPVRRKR